MSEKIRELREYTKNPNPNSKSIVDLIYMWFFATCLEEEFNTDGILTYDDYDLLSEYLADRYDQIGDCFKGHLPLLALMGGGTSNLNWDRGVLAMVRHDCEDYVKIRKG